MVDDQCELLLQSATKLDDEQYSRFVALCVINVLLSISAVVGNILVLLAIIKTPSLHSPSYTLLFSLAISDLGVGVVVQPLHVALTIWTIQGSYENFCTVRIVFWFATAVFSAASYLTIVVISIDRFLAVYLRLRYRSVVTMSRSVGAVVAIWIFTGMVVGATRAGVSQYGFAFALTAILLWVVSFAITSFVFFMSLRIIRQSQAQVQSQLSRETRQHFPSSSFNLGAYKRSVYSMLYVYGLFVICYLPIILQFVFLLFLTSSSTFMAIYHEIALAVVFLNSSANPFLYFWRIRDLRKAMRGILFARNDEQASFTTAQTS